MNYKIMSSSGIIDYKMTTHDGLVLDAYDIYDANIQNEFQYFLDDEEVSFNDFILNAINNTHN